MGDELMVKRSKVVMVQYRELGEWQIKTRDGFPLTRTLNKRVARLLVKAFNKLDHLNDGDVIREVLKAWVRGN